MANAVAIASCRDAETLLVEVLREIGAEAHPVLAREVERCTEDLVVAGDTRLRNALGPAPRRCRLYSLLDDLVERGVLEDAPGGLRLR